MFLICYLNDSAQNGCYIAGTCCLCIQPRDAENIFVEPNGHGLAAKIVFTHGIELLQAYNIQLPTLTNSPAKKGSAPSFPHSISKAVKHSDSKPEAFRVLKKP